MKVGQDSVLATRVGQRFGPLLIRKEKKQKQVGAHSLCPVTRLPVSRSGTNM